MNQYSMIIYNKTTTKYRNSHLNVALHDLTIIQLFVFNICYIC